VFKKCTNEIREVRKKEMQANKRPAMDLGKHLGKSVRSNLAELPNTTFTVMIRWVSNCNNFVLTPTSLSLIYR
jgi:hypothetical protein